MGCLRLSVLNFILCVTLVNSAAILNDDVEQQGLYNSKTDKVIILNKANFEQKVYGKSYAQLVQFYNSYCGHCRNFYTKYKSLAYEIIPWKKVFRLAVIDCFDEDNNEACRDFEVMYYPSLRYVHENYVKGNGNVGERIPVTDTAQNLKDQIIFKMQLEQQHGQFRQAPSLSIFSFSTYDTALAAVPVGTRFAFFVFEDANSTIGSELVLDTCTYDSVSVIRVDNKSGLAKLARVKSFPAVVGVEIGKTVPNVTISAQNITTKASLLQAMKSYLQSHHYTLPIDAEIETVPTEKPDNTQPTTNLNRVYYSDLEKTIKSILHTEINHVNLNSESQAALVNLLRVIRDYFPFKGKSNFKNYIEELLYHAQISSGNAEELTKTVKKLEQTHNPYTSSSSDYIGCKGSQPKYRGYTCGLWTLFHTLTVGAATRGPSHAGPQVLQAMHGFVKYFFGCTHCVQHFLAMAERNRLFDVKDNDKAVLWLWVSHNEVNLRLAGDLTEDPAHPKIQFPSVTQCPHCRIKNGAWNLPEVYQYLLTFYNSDNIQDGSDKSAAAPFGQLTNLDLGMLSFLYILSFIIIILVIRFFITKRFYRKRIYKNGLGKV